MSAGGSVISLPAANEIGESACPLNDSLVLLAYQNRRQASVFSESETMFLSLYNNYAAPIVAEVIPATREGKAFGFQLPVFVDKLKALVFELEKIS
jgi:hypothetical protein